MGKGAGKGGKKAKVSGKGAKPGAPTLRNGEKICMAWNEGKCSHEGEACPNGKHVCNPYT